MIKIFISYRREDAPYAARHINDALCRRFGRRNVYFDMDTNKPGLDFREQIDRSVSKCDVMLVIIGDRWLQLDDSSGEQVMSPGEFVTWEVSSALNLGIPVIPVLVQDAKMLDEQLIPTTLSQLVYRHAVEIRANENFQGSITRLVDSIKSVVAGPIPNSRVGTLEILKRFLIASFSLVIIQHVLTLIFLDSPKKLGMGFFMLGFIVLLCLGVYVSVKSNKLNFQVGVYQGVLIPILAPFAWYIVYAILWNTPLPNQTSLILSVIGSSIMVGTAYIRLLKNINKRDSE